MPWNKIAISQDGKDDLLLLLVDPGELANYTTWRGSWWYCDDSKPYYRYGSDKSNYLWQFLIAPGVLEIGGLERKGYGRPDDPIVFQPWVRLWPARREGPGKLLVALGSGEGEGKLDPNGLNVGPGVSGFDKAKRVTWSTGAFGTGTMPYGKCKL